MRSKKSKQSTSPSVPAQPLWKVEPNCSEPALWRLAGQLAVEMQPQDRVLLEGPMGAGKTTFARALLKGLGVEQPAEGSPSFAIVHEYQAPLGDVIHLDLYRLRSESELEDAGVLAYFWEREAVVISEWVSQFPSLESEVLADHRYRIWKVSLDFVDGCPEQRKVTIQLCAS